MESRGLLRDVLLLVFALAVGWWLRGPQTTVLAGRSSDESLGFQLGDGSPQQSLTIYNPENHTLYVYPRVGTGNAHISCEYSLRIERPGGPIDRQNCPMGSQY